MSLRFTNTLGGKIEEFQPLEGGVVRMYSCGPTVYGPPHVGNFRAFLLGDLVRRYLEWRGYKVTWVMNITDVDDRIIRESIASSKPIGDITAPHAANFIAELDRLRIGPPKIVRATEHIDEMASLVQTLIDKGHAYRTDDNSIFFRISSWPEYGKLAKIDANEARVGERVAADEYAKDDVRDFAVWKGPKPGEASWHTVVGEGRPGWHIECSAMSMANLGETFDIHTGGVDLIFPHHENEIAQSEGATGKPFVRYWLHNAHLQTGGERMARRVGNVANPAQIYEMGYSPGELRYALLSTYYRSPMEWSVDSLDNARAAVERLSTALSALESYTEDRTDDPTLDAVLSSAHDAFTAAMDDDLNVSGALAAVFDLVRELNRRVDARTLSTADARRAAATLRDFDKVLGVLDVPESLPDGAQELLDQRGTAREARNWAESDRLRDDLAKRGVLVEDTRDGQRWRLMPRSSDG